jgi:hypothetical protein
LRSPDLNAAPQKKSDAVRLSGMAGSSPAMTIL